MNQMDQGMPKTGIPFLHLFFYCRNMFDLYVSECPENKEYSRKVGRADVRNEYPNTFQEQNRKLYEII